MESANGIQTVKAIIDEIIGTSIVFEIKISQYNIQSQGRYGFTANKVFQVDYKLDSLQIQEDIEQLTEPSQILNDTFQAQLPHNMHQNSSTLMKEKQLPLERSTDIPNSSNKKNRTDKTYKRKAYVSLYIISILRLSHLQEKVVKNIKEAFRQKTVATVTEFLNRVDDTGMLKSQAENRDNHDLKFSKDDAWFMQFSEFSRGWELKLYPHVRSDYKEILYPVVNEAIHSGSEGVRK
ncbi:hypothetical protein IFM89_039938 [Coptis chinensis]|uniref:Uncharacterized protein n=1 Tax=Coptis chinensis TaxID=261450 RepID=A0A835LBX2_9MAGN|nr:hypothetical protein IFM89_039938 [Coptis chinensis]